MKIVSITSLENSFVRYDLEIEDNHNFVADGIVVHNSNVCIVYDGKNFHVKSRNHWKLEYPDISHLTVEYFIGVGKTKEEAEQLVENINKKSQTQCSFWKGLRINEPLQKLLIDNPGLFVFGELFGNTNIIKYHLPEVNRIAAFDVWKDGSFFDSSKSLDLFRRYGVEFAPLLHENVAFDDVNRFIEMAEGKTLIKDAKTGTIREGIVVKPTTELYDVKIGRLALKCKSPSFLQL